MENKKSFIAYVDWKETFDSLPDDKAGQLIKHLFAYVNDENPQTDDILIKAVFANIRQQLKRDLKKWEHTSTQRSDIGRLGGIKSGEARRSKTKQTKQLLYSRSKTKQNEHDTVNVNVNDNVNVISKEKKKDKFDFSFVEDEWKGLFFEWIEYKKSINDNYSTQQTIEACYRNIKTLSQNDTITGRRIIDNSIGNKYKGLFPLKETVKKNYAELNNPTTYIR